MAGSVNTNLTNRPRSGVPVGTVEVYDLSDLPAPSGGNIALENKLYIQKNQLSTSDSLLLPALGVVNWRVENELANPLTYTGSGTFIKSTSGIAHFIIDNADVFATNAAANIFGLLGLNGVGVSQMRARRCRFTGFGDIGTIGEFGFVQILECQFSGYTEGLDVDNVLQFAFDRVGLIAGASPITVAVGLTGHKTTRALFNIVQVVQSAEDFLAIDPDIADNAVIDINGTILSGGADFFASDELTGNVTNIVSAFVAAESITSVTDPGSGIARFNYSAPPGYFVDQNVVISGFTGNNAVYNGSFRITATGTSPDFIETGVGFVAGGTGSFISNSVRCTVTAHGFGDGQTLSIKNTINYNGGARIYNSQTDTFDINRPFVVNETTGTFDIGSLTEVDTRVFAFNNGAQKDSMNIAFGVANGNATPTTIAATDTHQALDVSGFTVNGAIELWTLINATNGIFRYDGLNPFVAKLTANITIKKTGSTEEYRFATSVNGAIPTFATADHVPIEVKTTKVSGTLIDTLTINPGDTVQIMGGGVSTSDNITVTDLQFEVAG